MKLTQETLDRYKGGQAEIQNETEGYLYRGEIAEIGVNGSNSLEIRFAWLAKGEGFPPFPARWVNDSTLHYAASLEIYTVSDIGEGRLCLDGWFTGDVTVLFPKGGSQLDPTRVEGLQLITS